MPFELLYNRLPELAEAETRTITLLQDDVALGLKAAHYSFCEMFCNEPGCDCRRVYLSVICSLTNNSEATISYGWENEQFYRNWASIDLSDHELYEIKGPSLPFGTRLTPSSDGILKLFNRALLPQQDYIDRIKRHYHLFRATVDKPRPSWARRYKMGG